MNLAQRIIIVQANCWALTPILDLIASEVCLVNFFLLPNFCLDLHDY